MHKAIVGAALLACVALGGYWTVQARWAARPTKLLPLVDTESHPSTTPPRSESAELQWARWDQATVPREAAKATGPGERTIPNNPEPELPRLSANAEDYRPYLQRQFLQQALDVSWARQAKSDLDTRLGHLLDKRSSVTSIECRASLCRVELTHQDERAYASFANAYAHAQVWKGPGFFSKQGETGRGEWIMVMFLAREGNELPDE
jgi:hypothetical protein